MSKYINPCFAKNEEGFVQYIANIEKMRTWVAAHRLLLDKVEFSCNEYSGTIDLGLCKYSMSDDPRLRDHREVAKLFGAEGWIRERNPHSCGSIDWVKVVDGVRLKIEGAEHAPELKKEVRL